MFLSATVKFLASQTASAITALTPISKKTITTTDFFSPWTYYILPIALILYAIIIAWKTDFDFMAKIKRLYYSVMIFALVIILKCVNLIGIGKEGLWGTTPKAWSVILFVIIYTIAIVLIDNYVISGYVFKEFGFFGTKFIKDDATETVKSQMGYINSLESSIKAQYEMIERIKTDTERLAEDKLDFNVQIGKIITDFYTCKNIDVQVETYNFDKGNYDAVIEKLTKQHDLDPAQIRELESRLQKNLFYYLKGRGTDFNLFHFIITSEFRPELEIGIAIKLNGKYNLKDQYILTNLIYFYELCLVKLRQVR